MTTNHAKDLAQLEAIQHYITSELQHGAMLGPFDVPPFQPWVQTSPMMTHPKKNTTEKRVIVDLTWPHEASVNFRNPPRALLVLPLTYSLPNVMDAADEVARKGWGCYLWTADLARPYRQLRGAPCQHHYMASP